MPKDLTMQGLWCHFETEDRNQPPKADELKIREFSYRGQWRLGVGQAEHTLRSVQTTTDCSTPSSRMTLECLHLKPPGPRLKNEN